MLMTFLGHVAAGGSPTVRALVALALAASFLAPSVVSAPERDYAAAGSCVGGDPVCSLESEGRVVSVSREERLCLFLWSGRGHVDLALPMGGAFSVEVQTSFGSQIVCREVAALQAKSISCEDSFVPFRHFFTQSCQTLQVKAVYAVTGTVVATAQQPLQVCLGDGFAEF